jgi:hypothetical protein
MANYEVCDVCGEQEVDTDQFPDCVCSDCSDVSFLEATISFFEYVGGVADDIGFRECNCEDYPCCGH